MRKTTLLKGVALSLSVALVAGLTACGEDENADPLLSESKESLINRLYDYDVQLVNAKTEISNLNEQIKALMQTTSTVSAGVVTLDDGTGRKTFKTVDGLISLPGAWNFPGSEQAPNTSSINVSSTVVVTPTYNWSIQFAGTKIEVYHTSEVSGLITVGNLGKEAKKYDMTLLQDAIGGYFEQIPYESLNYSRIYVNNEWRGMDVKGTTTVDGDIATLRGGMLSVDETSVQYFFIYADEPDSARDEVILSLIKTLTINKKTISIE